MFELPLLVILSVFGLVFGSFISALSYRTIRGVSIFKGRSFCDNCKKKINWYDNVPIISFLLLKGKSRCCGKPISIRYPLIEFFTMTSFLLSGIFYNRCISGSPICVFKDLYGGISLFVVLTVNVFLITVFITDLEHKIIPDAFVFIPYCILLFLLIYFNPDYSYANLFLSFGIASFFLFVHLLTKGKGMGLGDVKLALLPPIILGWPYSIIWLFLSFIIGAVVGILLILFGKAKFGKQIPFGPFLIATYFLVLFWGSKFLFLMNL